MSTQNPEPADQRDPADDFFNGTDDDDTELEFTLIMHAPADDATRSGTSE